MKENAWLSYSEEQKAELEALAGRYRKFLDAGKTERECAAEAIRLARAAGYVSLEEVQEAGWKLLAHSFDLHHDEEMVKGNVMTEYEEKFSKAGNPICKMVISR